MQAFFEQITWSIASSICWSLFRSIIRSHRIKRQQNREEFCKEYMKNNQQIWAYTDPHRQFVMFAECAQYVGQLNKRRYKTTTGCLADTGFRQNTVDG